MKNRILRELRAQDQRTFLTDLMGELGETNDKIDFEDNLVQLMYECYDDPSAVLDVVQQAFNAGWDARGLIP